MRDIQIRHSERVDYGGGKVRQLLPLQKKGKRAGGGGWGEGQKWGRLGVGEALSLKGTGYPSDRQGQRITTEMTVNSPAIVTQRLCTLCSFPWAAT